MTSSSSSSSSSSTSEPSPADRADPTDPDVLADLRSLIVAQTVELAEVALLSGAAQGARNYADLILRRAKALKLITQRFPEIDWGSSASPPEASKARVCSCPSCAADRRSAH